MNNFWLNNKSGIISGIVASAIFLYCFQPILETTSRIFINISVYIGTAYVDRIYAQAAHLETQDFSFVLFIFFTAFITSVILSIAIPLLLSSLANQEKKNIEAWIQT